MIRVVDSLYSIQEQRVTETLPLLLSSNISGDPITKATGVDSGHLLNEFLVRRKLVTKSVGVLLEQTVADTHYILWIDRHRP